ncbi:MAG: ABC transporter ATP-binding protein [Planctomycetota bacterium]
MSEIVETEELALSAAKVCKRFGSRRVLKGLDLRVPRGAAYGFVGPNGAGKTTTISCALGLDRHDGGEIRVLGAAPMAIHRLGGRVAAVFDAPTFPPRWTVERSLAHARFLAGKRAAPPGEVEAALSLESQRKTRIGRLSLGNRRRVALAHALVARPEILFLDEPFSGLDAASVEDVIEFLAQERHERGTTLFLSSHRLDFIERVSTRVGLLHDGVLLVERDTETLTQVIGVRLRAASKDSARVRKLIESAPIAAKLVETEPGTFEVLAPEVPSASEFAAAVNRRLVEGGVEVFELAPLRRSLQDVYRAALAGEVERA